MLSSLKNLPDILEKCRRGGVKSISGPFPQMRLTDARGYGKNIAVTSSFFTIILGELKGGATLRHLRIGEEVQA